MGGRAYKLQVQEQQTVHLIGGTPYVKNLSSYRGSVSGTYIVAQYVLVWYLVVKLYVGSSYWGY